MANGRTVNWYTQNAMFTTACTGSLRGTSGML